MSREVTKYSDILDVSAMLSSDQSPILYIIRKPCSDCSQIENRNNIRKRLVLEILVVREKFRYKIIPGIGIVRSEHNDSDVLKKLMYQKALKDVISTIPP